MDVHEGIFKNRQLQLEPKVQISEGVASEAGLGLAMRLFKVHGFEILYEEKLETKVCTDSSLLR